MNHWFGIGNLTSDPEVRYTESGKAVASFSIAINNGKDRDGNERPPTYVDIVAWDTLGERCGEYLRKGRKCAVVGALTVEKYEDREGVKRVKYRIRANNVEFLSPREERDEEPTTKTRKAVRDDLDEVPF